MSNKIALVTGGSSGIGEATALALVILSSAGFYFGRAPGYREVPFSDLLTAFATVLGSQQQLAQVRELELALLHPGLVFMEDVRSSSGALLIIIGALVYFGIKIVGVGPEWLISVAVTIVGAGWVWLGQALWSESGESAQQPKRVR